MITVKEIARLAGVSPKTAERALSGATKDKRSDARERAERVRRIAAQYGYRPSELALALRRGSIRSIGFLTDILTDQFLAAAVETAMDEALKQNYKVALRVVRFDRKQTVDAIEAFLASKMDGIITSCCSEQLPPELMKQFAERKFPLFTLCGQSEYPFSSAAPDYSQALPRAVEALAAKGHRRITLCLFTGKRINNEHTRKIFENACASCGVEADYRLHDERHQAAELADEKIPALILYGKYSMRIFFDRCAETGFKPDVIGFYNEWTLAAARSFPLCGIILENGEAAVRGAIRQLLDEVSGAPGGVHISPPAVFIPENGLKELKVADLANQLLFE